MKTPPPFAISDKVVCLSVPDNALLASSQAPVVGRVYCVRAVGRSTSPSVPWMCELVGFTRRKFRDGRRRGLDCKHFAPVETVREVARIGRALGLPFG